jgi:hypothetical protein
MPRSATPTLLIALALLAGCGGDEPASSSSGGGDRAAEPTREAQPTEAAPSGGLTGAQFRALRLRTPRTEVVSSLGKPTKVTRAERDSECLEYKALDDAGKVDDTQRYTLCFNAQDQLSVLTTTPILK